MSGLGIEGMTVVDVKGFGRQRGHTELYRGAEYQVDFIPKIKIEIATQSDNVDRVVDAISSVAQTGKIGDGKIFVYDLEQIVRIRTGELDEAAI
jgi:nitrogen regulatory protein P-II 2